MIHFKPLLSYSNLPAISQKQYFGNKDQNSNQPDKKSFKPGAIELIMTAKDYDLPNTPNDERTGAALGIVIERDQNGGLNQIVPRAMEPGRVN